MNSSFWTAPAWADWWTAAVERTRLISRQPQRRSPLTCKPARPPRPAESPESSDFWAATPVSDKIIGKNVPNVWRINEAESGSVANASGNVNFVGFESVTGGTDADRFSVETGGGVTGTLSGGTGIDKLDYSVRSGPVTVNLAASTASGRSRRWSRSSGPR